jgi:hypothetical protein
VERPGHPPLEAFRRQVSNAPMRDHAVNEVAAAVLKEVDVIDDFCELVEIMENVTKYFMETTVYPMLFLRGLESFQLLERGGLFRNRVEGGRVDVLPWPVFENWLRMQLLDGNGGSVVGFEWIARMIEIENSDWLGRVRVDSSDETFTVKVKTAILDAHRPKLRLWEIERSARWSHLLRFLNGKSVVLDHPLWPRLGWCLSYWEGPAEVSDCDIDEEECDEEEEEEEEEEESRSANDDGEEDDNDGTEDGTSDETEDSHEQSTRLDQ